MYIAVVVVGILAAAWVGFSAVSLLRGAKWIAQSLTDYGVPRAWWPWLGVAKSAGALGLAIGLLVPILGVVAGGALIVYFLGAVATVIRARSYSHVPYPLMYLLPVAAATALRLVTSSHDLLRV